MFDTQSLCYAMNQKNVNLQEKKYLIRQDSNIRIIKMYVKAAVVSTF